MDAENVNAPAATPEEESPTASEIAQEYEHIAESAAPVVEDIAEKLAGGPAEPAPTPAAVPKPAAPRGNGVFDIEGFRASLPAQVDEIIFYSKPAVSAAVLGSVFVAYLLIFVDFGINPMYLAGFFGKYVLAFNVAVTLLFKAYLKITKKEGSGNPLTTFAKPHVERALTVAGGMVPTRDAVFGAASTGLDTVVGLGSAVGRAFYVEDLALATKSLGALYGLQIFAGIFSIRVVVFLVVAGFATLPAVYQKFQAPIDDALRKAWAKAAPIIDQIKSKIPGMKAKAQ